LHCILHLDWGIFPLLQWTNPFEISGKSGHKISLSTLPLMHWGWINPSGPISAFGNIITFFIPDFFWCQTHSAFRLQLQWASIIGSNPGLTKSYRNLDLWHKILTFLTKISVFTKSSILEQNFDFRTKLRFLNKISIFEQNFDFSTNFDFWTEFIFFNEIYIFELFYQKFRFTY